jgi:hypothetical protein
MLADLFVQEAGPEYANMYAHAVIGQQQVIDIGKHGRFHGYVAMKLKGADPKKILSAADYQKGVKDGTATKDPLMHDFDLPFFLKKCSAAMDSLGVPKRNISVVFVEYPHGPPVSGWMYPSQQDGPIYMDRRPSSKSKGKYAAYKGPRSPHTMLHEYAHVIWYKDLSKAQREAIKTYWMANVKGNPKALSDKISPSDYGITGGLKAASHPWTEWWPEIAGYSMYGGERLNPSVEKFAKDLLSGKLDMTPQQVAGPEKQTLATPAPPEPVEPKDPAAKKVKDLLSKQDAKVKKVAGDYQVQYRPDKTIRIIPSKGAHDMGVLAQIAQVLKFDKHASLPLRARYSTGSQGGLVLYAEGVDIESALEDIREEDMPYVYDRWLMDSEESVDPEPHYVDTPGEEDTRMPIVVEAGKPVGKAQVALYDIVKAAGESQELSDIARDKRLHGVHFKQLMSAAKALSKKGLINYDGISNVSPKEAVEHRLAPVHEGVAKEIMSQIGRQALFMIGAKQFVDHGDALTFRVGRNKITVNIIRVTYNKGKDDYTLEFLRQRGVNLKTVKTVPGVYAEDLTRIIGDTLGMAVKMPVVHFKRNESVDEAGYTVSARKRADGRGKYLEVYSGKRKVASAETAGSKDVTGLSFAKKPVQATTHTKVLRALKAAGYLVDPEEHPHSAFEESVDEMGVYAHPAQPPKWNEKKKRLEKPKGPWYVNVDLYSGADIEALMAAFDSDDETDWPMKKSEFGFGLRLTVDAPTRKDAEEMVRSALARFGWAEKEPPDMSMGAMAPISPSPVMASEAEVPKIKGVKRPKDEVGYQDHPSTDGNRCADCAYVDLPTLCKKVEGTVDEDGHCNLWKRGIAS